MTTPNRPDYYWNRFPNVGFISFKFTDEQLAPVREEISKIQDNFSAKSEQKNNHRLAGNLEKQFCLIESKQHLEKLIFPFINCYDNEYNYLCNIDSNTEKQKIVLDRTWVNFQSKNEFNPVHKHTGLMSYALWLKVPYDIEEEKKFGPGKESVQNLSGHFSFLYLNSLGQICTHNIPVDKTYENTCVLFPSSMYHCVYPFVTSNEYRISVSGNFKFKS